MYENLLPNQCKFDKGGCSGCGVDGKHVSCKFGIKHSDEKTNHCRYWKFDEYCDCLKAQEAADPSAYSG